MWLLSGRASLSNWASTSTYLGTCIQKHPAACLPACARQATTPSARWPSCRGSSSPPKSTASSSPAWRQVGGRHGRAGAGAGCAGHGEQGERGVEADLCVGCVCGWVGGGTADAPPTPTRGPFPGMECCFAAFALVLWQTPCSPCVCVVRAVWRRCRVRPGAGAAGHPVHVLCTDVLMYCPS